MLNWTWNNIFPSIPDADNQSVVLLVVCPRPRLRFSLLWHHVVSWAVTDVLYKHASSILKFEVCRFRNILYYLGNLQRGWQQVPIVWDRVFLPPLFGSHDHLHCNVAIYKSSIFNLKMDGAYSSDTSKYAHKITQPPTPPPQKDTHKLNSQLRENLQIRIVT
jgi:hypothetical protein